MAEFQQEHHDLLAALVLMRFNNDQGAAIEAWKRLLDNDGWDDGGSWPPGPARRRLAGPFGRPQESLNEPMAPPGSLDAHMQRLPVL